MSYSERTRRRPLRGGLLLTLAAVNIVLTLALIVSDYAGYLDPAQYRWSGIAIMCFPILAVVSLILFLFNTLLLRCVKIGMINLAGLLICSPLLWSYCPLNFPEKPKEDEKTIRILTYNVQAFLDQQTGEIDPKRDNPSLQFILKEDADIVCIQEIGPLAWTRPTQISKAEVDSLYRRYPYRLIPPFKRGLLSIYSKYPLRKIEMDLSGKYYCEAMAARVDVDGFEFDLVNVHLESFGLTKDDKSLYRSITKGKTRRDEIDDVKEQLLLKIARASEERGVQAMEIKHFADTASRNLIVCGDFNDVPGCYTLRTLARTGLKETYPKAGFGPAITYWVNRFYFRIDHILYRGQFRPVSIDRPTAKSSDHYPLIATYVINP